MNRLLTIALGLVSLSCSALGLTNVTEQEGCRDCSELNAIEAPGQCMSWQCAPEGHPEMGLCIIGPLDGDEDGAPLAECAPEGVLPDCDDTNATVFPARAGEQPAADELPDGLDNDCDGSTDEGLGFALEPRDEDLSAAFAEWSVSGDSIAVVAVNAGGVLSHGVRQGGPLNTLIATRSTPMTLAPGPVQVRGTAAIAHSDVGQILAGDDNRWDATCSEPFVGRVELGMASSDTPLDGDRPTDPVGLPRSSTCDSGDPPDLQHVGIASPLDQTRALLVGREADDPGGACGMVPESDVTALLLLESLSTPRHLAAIEATARVIGTSDHAGGPGVHALLDDPLLRYLVVFASGGTLQMRVVVADGNVVTVTDPLAGPADASCGEACGVARIASARVDSVPTIGVAYRAGTCANPERRFQRFSVSPSGLTALDATPITAAAPGLVRVALGARDAAPSFAVGHTTATSIHIQRVGAEGPFGSELTGFTPPVEMPTDQPEGISGAFAIAYTDDAVQLGFRAGQDLRFAVLAVQ